MFNWICVCTVVSGNLFYGYCDTWQLILKSLWYLATNPLRMEILKSIWIATVTCGSYWYVWSCQVSPHHSTVFYGGPLAMLLSYTVGLWEVLLEMNGRAAVSFKLCHETRPLPQFCFAVQFGRIRSPPLVPVLSYGPRTGPGPVFINILVEWSLVASFKI